MSACVKDEILDGPGVQLYRFLTHGIKRASQSEAIREDQSLKSVIKSSSIPTQYSSNHFDKKNNNLGHGFFNGFFKRIKAYWLEEWVNYGKNGNYYLISDCYRQAKKKRDPTIVTGTYFYAAWCLLSGACNKCYA